MKEFIKNNILLIILVSLVLGIVEALFTVFNESKTKISYDKGKELEHKSSPKQDVRQDKHGKFLFV